MHFTLNIDPPRATAQQKGERVVGGHVIHYTKANVKDAERLLMTAMLPHRPTAPIPKGTAVRLSVTYRFPTKVKRMWCRPKKTRPDLDNTQKLLQDVMTRLGFWEDDGQIAYLRLCKLWDENGSIDIDIEKWEE